jgi:hypothetical protein
VSFSSTLLGGRVDVDLSGNRFRNERRTLPSIYHRKTNDKTEKSGISLRSGYC